MTASTNQKISVAERLRFSTNKTLDTHIYIRLYSQALDTHMETEQRQSFFMIAKMLTDGTIALHKKYKRLADYYFELSENYIKAIPKNQTKYLNFIANIYGRSKSFHYFKNGDIDNTIKLVEKCLDATIELEKMEGLEFLILDRISQYENLARVYFSKNETTEGFKIISDCLIFLMTGKPNTERTFNDKYLKDKNPDYYNMKTTLMINLFADTIVDLQKESDREIYTSSSLLFLTPIFQNLNDLSCHTSKDLKLKECLDIIHFFYSDEILKFKKLAIPFINSSSTEIDSKLTKLTSAFFQYC